MIQSPSEGEDLKRQGFGERRRLEERRSSGERRRTKHRRKGETLSMLRACPPSLQVFSPQDNVALKTPPSQERRDGTQERWQAEERIRLEALLDSVMFYGVIMDMKTSKNTMPEMTKRTVLILQSGTKRSITTGK